MPTPSDVIHNLARLSDGQAARRDARHTGVVPGYKPRHGFTTDEQGRITYIKEDWSPGAVAGGTTVICSRARRLSSKSVSDGTETLVNFDDVTFDPEGCIQTIGESTWKWVAPSDGFAQCVTRLDWASQAWSAGANMKTYIAVNGSHASLDNDLVDVYYIPAAFTGRMHRGPGYMLIQVSEGDELQFYAYQSNGSTKTLAGSDTTIEIVFFGDAVAVGGGVGAHYEAHISGASTTTSLASGGTSALIYDIEDLDTYNEANSGVWAAGTAGTYQITASLASTGVASWAGGDTFEIKLYVNGSLVTSLDSFTGPASGDVTLSGSHTMAMSAGDYVTIVATMTRSPATSVSFDTSGASSITIDRTA